MDGANALIVAGLFALGYLSGSVPYGLVLTRAFGLGDLRSIGSGNIGATNALRTGNKTLAILTLLADVLKGTLPVLIGWQFGAAAAMGAGFGAFLGHLFPVWLGFKGGKGVATYIGILIGFSPIGLLVFAVSWLGMAAIFRYSSLAALTATLVVPVAYYLLGDMPAATLSGILTVLVYIKHRPNIERLLAGTEGRIGAKGLSLPAGSGAALRLSDAQRLAWLRLIRSENVGPITFRALVNRFGGAEAALDALPDLASRGGSKRRIAIASLEAAEQEMALAERLGARFVCLGEPDYPAALRAADPAPPLLAVMGGAQTLLRPSVAIVGARNASLAGVKFAGHLARGIGEGGFVVVSGVARGIDAAAHEASLPTGTIGVFAGGLDKPYPRENRPLMRRIVDGGGCLVSEMPFGWEPRAIDFPRRNRIVAGLSLGLLVIEAAMRSGSLISARLAGELGRLVFAVPGSPLDPRAAGTNRLLKDGAILVTEAGDVVDALTPLAGGPPRMPLPPFEEPSSGPVTEEPSENERERILQALGPVPTELDDLIAFTGAAPGVVQLAILELDLAGRIERHSGGRVSLLS